jgi:hypothetical protein
MSSSSQIYYHVKPTGLAAGAILLRGSYGQCLTGQGLSATSDPLKEHLRETIRQLHYDHKPSRLSSSFVFETLVDATFFRDHWRLGMSIYQVRFCNPPTVLHRVCYTAWDEKFPNQLMQAHEFWNRPPLYSANTELFAEEDLVVVSCCD